MTKTKTTLKKTATSKAPSKSKQRKKKLIITTLAIGATGILGYFGWQYFKKKKQAKANHADIDAIINNMDQPIVLQPNPPKVKVKPPSRTYTLPTADQRNDEFPLKKGSKGENVRKLQEALMTKYGKSVLPKYGADGDFGSEMVTALKN